MSEVKINLAHVRLLLAEQDYPKLAAGKTVIEKPEADNKSWTIKQLNMAQSQKDFDSVTIVDADGKEEEVKELAEE